MNQNAPQGCAVRGDEVYAEHTACARKCAASAHFIPFSVKMNKNRKLKLLIWFLVYLCLSDKIYIRKLNMRNEFPSGKFDLLTYAYEDRSSEGGEYRVASENREKILEATLKVFNRKGLKFTMDDIASELGMSKKTIYAAFKDKESMFLGMVDYCFDKIKVQKDLVLEDEALSTTEKLRKVLGVMPDGYREIDFGKLYVLKDKYPMIYRQVEARLESGWEGVMLLIEQGIKEGVIRSINTCILKTMMEATLEQFFQRDVLVMNRISYSDALQEVVDILIQGIVE